MRRVLVVLLGFFLPVTLAHAMEGSFDRSAEVEKYIEVFKNGTRGAVIDSSREIVNGGITDASLAAAINERLLRDYKSADRFNTTVIQYVQWMARALAANGLTEYAGTIKQVAKEGAGQSTRKLCTEELSKLGWYKARNKLMSDKKYFSEGGDRHIAQLTNLLMDADFSFKLFAADRMNWERILDPNLMEIVSQQVLQYMDRTVHGVARDQAKTMGLYIKLLGYSGNIKYRDTLERVRTSHATSLMKKYADESLKRLRQ